MKRNIHKKKSNFGVWLDDQEDINIYVLAKASGISYTTIAKLCNNPNYFPNFSTIAKINKGLKELGKSVVLIDYLDK